MREKILLDNDWKFHRGDLPKKKNLMKGAYYISAKTERMLLGPAAYLTKDDSYAFEPKEMCDENWENVDLPHDYVIEGTPSTKYPQARGYLKYENAWYRKHFNLSPEDTDKRILLYFEGVATNATVYLNGCLVKHNFCGYTPFEIDVTSTVYFDKENVLAVYTDTSDNEGWWYEGGGIYRHVWLIKTDKIAVDLWGVYVNPQKNDNGWTVNTETTLINSSENNACVMVKSVISDQSGNEVGSAENNIDTCAWEKSILNQQIDVKEPLLWDIDSPNLYSMTTYVCRDGKEIDKTITKFGFRTFYFDAEKGFFLNGRNVKIKGVCSHQDYGLTGRAIPDNLHHYRAELIKEMGANGYRTSHYPHAEAMMDALDEIGILVMDETRWFEATDEGKEQLASLVKRDRNHPSVILWSVGNEEPKHLTEQGRRITKALKALVLKYDKSRPVTTAVSDNPIAATVFDTVDVIGVNYNLHQYDELHKRYPEKPFVSSECCATGSTRGWYKDDSETRSFLSAYDKDTTKWFISREKTWKFVMERNWVAGAFQWIAIEHRGECVWPRLCSQSGAIDMYLQKKDAFYQNQSHWLETPMIHLMPHWNHEGMEGEEILVRAYTNCEETELFLNGRSLGVKKVERFGHADWIVKYEKGTVEAVGRNGGKEIVRDIVRTSGHAAALKLKQDNTLYSANGQDLLLFTCYCVDENGITVPDAEPFVKFDINRFGKIVGTGSDITDHVSPMLQDRKMRAGLCSVAVKAGSEPGCLKLYASAENLKNAVISVELE